MKGQWKNMPPSETDSSNQDNSWMQKIGQNDDSMISFLKEQSLELPVQREIDFDLSINAVLSKNYSYKENSQLPFVNELNKWLKERVLIWDTGSNKSNAITFNLPKTLTPESEINQSTPEEIQPKLVSISLQNGLFPDRPTDQIDKCYLDKEAERQIEYQNVFDDLNSAQISEIWQTGKFTRYIQDGSHEVWYIRPWVFHGKEECYKIIEMFYECASSQFKYSRKRIYSEKVMNSIRHNPQRPWLEEARRWYYGLNILNGIRSIIGIPGHLIFLIFGVKIYSIDYDKFDKEVLKLLSSKIEKEVFSGNEKRYGDISFLQHVKANSEMYDFTQFEVNQNDEILQLTKKIYDGSLVLDLSKTNDRSTVKQILQDHIYESVIEKASNYLRSKDVSLKIISSFEETYRSQIAMERIKQLRTKWDYRNENFESIALDYLKGLKCEKHHTLFELIINVLKKGVTMDEVNKIKIKLREPANNETFEVFHFIPSVQKVKQGDSFVYTEKPPQKMKVSSTYFGWKLVYQAKSVYFLLLSFINLCCYMAFNSFVSFKSAFYSEKYSNRFTVDPKSGILIEEKPYDQLTLTSYYRYIRAKANNNIEYFESKPDNGLLGKSIARICNRLENWVYWHFLYGFLFVNIFLRIIFTLLSLIFLVLMPLSVVSFPIILLARILITVFLMDILTPFDKTEWEFPARFPIIDLLVWRLMIRGIPQIFLSLIFIIFHALLGGLIMLFAFIVYILRRAMDCVTFIFIYSCGRIPGGDSYLAYSSYYGNQKRKGAQGLSSTKTQLTFKQVQKLINAELDKRILTAYREEMVLKIKEPMKKNDSIMNELTQEMPFNFESNKVTLQYNSSANKIIANLDEQISNRRKSFPFLAGKQKEEFGYAFDELVSLKQSAIEYLQKTFARNPFFMKVIWKEFKVESGNYELLCLALFNQIFYDGRETPVSVLEKLRHKDAPAQADSIKEQIDAFLKYKFNIKSYSLQNPLEFLSCQSFKNKVLAAQDSKKQVFNIKKNEFNNYDELLLINAAPLNTSGEHFL